MPQGFVASPLVESQLGLVPTFSDSFLFVTDLEASLDRRAGDLILGTPCKLALSLSLSCKLTSSLSLFPHKGNSADRTWVGWDSWGACNVTCGSGKRSRIRLCTFEPSCLGTPCEEEDSEQLESCGMECGGKHPQTKAGNQTNNDVHPITTAAAAATVAGGVI